MSNKVKKDWEPCAGCKHYKHFEANDKQGECHRYPPRSITETTMDTRYPIVNYDDGCGEWVMIS